VAAGREAPTIVRAPAKVNLYLGVGGVRSDGYHRVDTVLQALSLADEVVIDTAGTLTVATEPDLGLAAQDNLAFRAARALGEAFGRSPAVSVRILKRIPAQAGLGGASADAAAVLVGLAHRWGLGPAAAPVLRDVAAALGADVPFFLGPGTALYAGRGDVPVRSLATPRLDLALVRPPVPVPTGAAYAAFDRLGGPQPPGSEAMVRACESGEAERVAAELYNNLTEASAGLVPEVADALAFVQSAPGVLGAAMAGSGSAVFAVCASTEAAAQVVSAARERGWWASTATSADSGATVTEGE